MQYLKRGPWAALPKDEDGGFCLVEKVELQHEASRIFSKERYREATNTLDSEVAEDIFRCAREVTVAAPCESDEDWRM